MSEVLHSIWSAILSASLVEQLTTLTGVVGVWLMIKESLWAFPVGLVQVCLSALVFHDARLYADMNLQAVFFGALAYGWWHWTHPKNKTLGLLTVGHLSVKGWFGALLGGVLGTWIWGWYLTHHTDAAMPYRDALISSFSIVGQWLQARKKLENWYAWILVNAIAVPVYWLNQLYWLSVLYLIFLVLAVAGLLEWRRSERASLSEARTADKPAAPQSQSGAAG